MCSLTLDGGLVPLMDMLIVKLFPEAYMNGQKGSREPPWDSVEEARQASVWKVGQVSASRERANKCRNDAKLNCCD